MSLKMKIIIGLLCTCMIIGISTAYPGEIIRQKPVSNITESELMQFLDRDLTDQREYTNFFTCGNFARTLARNATQYNITLGGLIVSPGPSFQDRDNHILNYVFVNGNLTIIEPQTDMTGANEYEYFRLYPNGRYVPSRW